MKQDELKHQYRLLSHAYEIAAQRAALARDELTAKAESDSWPTQVDYDTWLAAHNEMQTIAHQIGRLIAGEWAQGGGGFITRGS